LFSLRNRHRNLLSEGAASYCHPINFSLTNGEIFVTLTDMPRLRLFFSLSIDCGLIIL